MILQVLKSSLLALGIGFIIELVSMWLSIKYLTLFFEANLITILVALLAVNAATMGIVLTKMRDLIDQNGVDDVFTNTRNQMLLSVKEQIGLIIVSIVLLSIKSSPFSESVLHLHFFLNASVVGVFSYALLILYDTAKSVLIIVDY